MSSIANATYVRGPRTSLEIHDEPTGVVDPFQLRYASSSLWARLGKGKSMSIVVSGLLLALILLLAMFRTNGTVLRPNPTANIMSDGLESVLGAQSSRGNGFTLVTPTYKRAEMLPDFLRHYASGDIPSLKRVVLQWIDTETEPPSSLTDLLPLLEVPISIQHPLDRSLNERFRESEYTTTDCILSIDDDMIYTADDVEFAYQIWKDFAQGRKQMVGFHQRERTHDSNYIPSFESYSMVLTKGAFYHRDWMKAYWSPDAQMSGLRAYVDEHRNCEDILLSFLYARHTRVAPVWVNAPFRDLGLRKGISSEDHHYQARTNCIRHFQDVFGTDTLISSHVAVARMH